MKTKLFFGLTAGIVAIAAAAIVTASSVNTCSTQSDLLTKNLEVLTQGEWGGEHDCDGGKNGCLIVNGRKFWKP